MQEPSTTKNSSSSRAPKTGAQLRDNPEERENCGKTVKKKLHRRHTQHCWKLCTRLCCTTGMSTDSDGELNLRHFHSFQHEEHNMYNNGPVNNLVQELDAQATTFTTGTSTTLSEHCICGNLHSFLVFETKNVPVVATTGKSPPCPRTATAELPGLHCLDQNPCLAQQRARQPCP